MHAIHKLNVETTVAKKALQIYFAAFYWPAFFRVFWRVLKPPRIQGAGHKFIPRFGVWKQKDFEP